MFNQTEAFITSMKLRELRKQRDLLRQVYADLRQSAANAQDDAERLQRLYTGLQDIKFAEIKLHPEIDNLQVLLYELETTTTELLPFWRDRLQRELASGELRTEIVFIFGALLDEWATANRPLEETTAQNEFRQTMFATLTTPPTIGNYRPLLDQLLGGFAGNGIAEELETDTHFKFYSNQIDHILRPLQRNPYSTPLLRDEANRYAEDQGLANELADALAIMIANLDEWNWSDEGVPTRTAWMRTRWRLLLAPDLPTACLLELLGMRWATLFDKLLPRSVGGNLSNLLNLLKNYPKNVGIDSQRKWLNKLAEQRYPPVVDVWSGDVVDLGRINKLSPTALRDYLTEHWGFPSSVIAHRAGKLGSMRGSIGEAYADDYEGGMNDVLELLNADLKLWRTLNPGKPAYVLKVDLQDFYPSVPHEVILYILEKLDMPEAHLAFFRKFLNTPLQNGDTVLHPTRGLPINNRLSHTLAEVLLRVMERHVQNTAQVQIIRVVDDITLVATSADELTKGWEALRQFCATCGLTLNVGKQGAVAVDGKLPNGLPTAPPTWMLIALHSDGEWRVNETDFNTFLANARTRVLREESIIARVERYNEALDYVVGALALGLSLGDVHREQVNQALARFHYQFFDDQGGIVDGLRHMLRERYSSDVDLPDSWMYYPITAGGLGLTQPGIHAVRFDIPYQQYESKIPDQRPENLLREYNAWSQYYSNLLQWLHPAEPRRTDVMETLVKDFIARGSKLSGGKQTDLGAYWRWILYTYGPQLLERFGTFRFLLAELVPVQLILQKRRIGANSVE